MLDTTFQEKILYRLRNGVLLIALAAFIGGFGAASSGVAGQSSAEDELLAGKAAEKSLANLRSATLQEVPFAKAIADLQGEMKFAIIVDHRIDPHQPVTLTTGMLDAASLLNRVAQSVGARATLTDRFAYVGPQESASRLRTVIALRRQELKSLRSKLGSEVYGSCVRKIGTGWERMMQPDQFVSNQIQAAGLVRDEDEALPYDLWRSQSLPPLELVDRLSLVLNQFDLTFQVKDDGRLQVKPVEQSPSIQKRIRVPSERRQQVDAFLSKLTGAKASWSGGRVSLIGRVEDVEQVEAIIRNETTETAEGDLRNQLFTMTIPTGSTVSRVIQSFKRQGVSVQMVGGAADQRQRYLDQMVQLEANRMKGVDFFPTLLKADGVEVTVEAGSVVIRFSQ